MPGVTHSQLLIFLAGVPIVGGSYHAHNPFGPDRRLGSGQANPMEWASVRTLRLTQPSSPWSSSMESAGPRHLWFRLHHHVGGEQRRFTLGPLLCRDRTCQGLSSGEVMAPEWPRNRSD